MESPENIQGESPSQIETPDRGQSPVQQADCVSESGHVSWGRCLLLGLAGLVVYLLIGFGVGAVFEKHDTIIGFFFGYSGIPLFVVILILSAAYQRGKKLLALSLAVPAVILVGGIGLVGTVPKILRESPVLSPEDRKPLEIRQTDGTKRLCHPHLGFSFPACAGLEDVSQSLPPLETQVAPFIQRYAYRQPDQNLQILVQVTRTNGKDGPNLQQLQLELKQSLLAENPQLLFVQDSIERRDNATIARLAGHIPDQAYFIALSSIIDIDTLDSDYMVSFVIAAQKQQDALAIADQIVFPR